jgi:hypothetical protein
VLVAIEFMRTARAKSVLASFSPDQGRGAPTSLGLEPFQHLKIGVTLPKMPWLYRAYIS